MNVGSGAQIRQLLFAGVPNAKGKGDPMEKIRYFKVGHPSCGWALVTIARLETASRTTRALLATRPNGSTYLGAVAEKSGAHQESLTSDIFP